MNPAAKGHSLSLRVVTYPSIYGPQLRKCVRSVIIVWAWSWFLVRAKAKKNGSLLEAWGDWIVDFGMTLKMVEEAFS